MFKSAVPYRLPAPWAMKTDKLEDQLSRAPFTPCASNELERKGWLPREGKFLTVANGRYLIRMCVEKKILPAKAIKKHANKLADAMEQQQGYAPGRKQMRELKERALQELLPHALSVESVTTAWIDPKAGFMFVDASSQGKADVVIELLRHSLDELPLSLVRTQVSATSFMTDMLVSNGIPGFSVDRDCELKAVGEERSAVRYVRHALDGDEISSEIKAHLAAGKMPTRLAMTFNDRVSFVLDEKGCIKSVALLDLVTESAEDAKDQDEKFEADFALYGGEFMALYVALLAAMGGEVPDSL